ncbi:MAG: bifunctional (p)ppGpp synthetase/guanosine-3',5'-bis(diphosphate) 3'-pyrophosphohydrolase [Polyangia bacterium]
MVRIDEILNSYTSRHANGDTSSIQRAYLYASRKHEGQTRQSGEPYMVHPMTVAKTVAELGLDSASVCAALLHDTIEDTDTTREELESMFGGDVARLVDAMTKLSKVQFTQRQERQAESFRKMLIATAKDIRVLLIKLADRLHNMSTLEHLEPARRERIAQETREIYAPLANRLGISWLTSELYDMAFAALEPEDHADLAARVAKKKRAREIYIKRTISELEKFLDENGYEARVSGRLKNLYSIYNKVVSQKVEYEKVHDAIAFRVICESEADCYAIFGLIHSRWVPIPGRIKDFIAMPKPNHYQSLHTTVVGLGGDRMEIQLRTEQMHRVAEYGVAAHWRYKEGNGEESDRVYHWLREMLEHQDGTQDSVEFVDSVKVDLLTDEVFVFTPAGDVQSLRRGATPLDFAYAIHTEVGNRCAGTRVNGVQVPFDSELQNGDWVEIVTSKTQRPSTDWLEIAKTSRARNKIRSFLRAEQREQSRQVGRDILEKELHKYGCSYKRMLKAGDVERVVSEMKHNSVDDLLAALGYGKLDKQAVIERLLPEEKRERVPPKVKETALEKVMRKVARTDNGIVLDGVDNLLVRFARCCNPLPGEDIIGYVSRGRGIVVHRRNCNKAAALDPERRIPVQWSSKAVSQRPVKLKVVTTNRPGVLAEMTNTFQGKGINIASAHCDTDGGERADNFFTFMVKDLAQLNDLIKALRQQKSVYEVGRVQN